MSYNIAEHDGFLCGLQDGEKVTDLSFSTDPQTRHIHGHPHTDTTTPTIAIGENATRCISLEVYLVRLTSIWSV